MEALPLLECVPNVSTADPGVVRELSETVSGAEGVKLLHIDTGESANRTVFTFLGPPAAVQHAAISLVEHAAACIDMRRHIGAHPRIGAVDVLPFVPLRGISMTEAIRIASEVGSTLGERLDIPVYMYGEAARLPTRKLLAMVRKGQYEGLAARLAHPDHAPDFGDTRFNPRFGAMAVGARKLLVAYNVNISSAELPLARRIAALVRTPPTGTAPSPYSLSAARAIGWYIPEFDCCQVSFNLVDISQTSMHQAFAAVEQVLESPEFAGSGVRVTGSELVGLAPLWCFRQAINENTPGSLEQAAIPMVLTRAENRMGLSSVKPFTPDQVLELTAGIPELSF